MLRKIILFVILGISTFLYGSVNAVVSIAPQKTFLEAIGGDRISVSLMVKAGSSPHTYEPKPSQMRDISKADIYFRIGVEFEKVWLEKFQNQNQKMMVVDTTQNIAKIMMLHVEHSHSHHKEVSYDPHIWTNPQNVKIIANNILKYLVDIDRANESYYERNYENFIAKIDRTHVEIKDILKNKKDAKFMVFHPAWGYFAKEYGLIQVAIEKEGKSPKPKEIINLINDAKKQNIRAVLTAPEFSDKIAKQIAEALNIPVIKISPLNPKYSKNLINLAKAIAN